MVFRDITGGYGIVSVKRKGEKEGVLGGIVSTANTCLVKERQKIGTNPSL